MPLTNRQAPKSRVIKRKVRKDLSDVLKRNGAEIELTSVPELTYEVTEVPALLSMTHYGQELPKVSWQLVTPELAEKWVAQTGVKRRLRRPKIRDYAGTMEIDDWMDIHPDPVVLDGHGNVINAQHRLQAIIYSRKSYYMLVVEYPPTIDTNKLAQTLDRGAPRSTADILTVGTGSTTPVENLAASTTRHMYFGLAIAATKIPDSTFVQFYSKHHRVILGTLAYFTHRSAGLARAATVAACARGAYHLEMHVIRRFVEVLQNGQSRTGAEGTIVALRNWLIKQTPRATGGQLSYEIYARTAYALDMYAQDRELTYSRMVQKDPFPLPEDTQGPEIPVD